MTAAVRSLLCWLLFCLPVAGMAEDKAPLEFRMFSGVEPSLFPNSVLIMGKKEAVLVDGQWWLSEGRRLADWVAESGRTLTTILVTHAHPDHYTGLNPVLEKFPGARVLARKSIRDVILYEYPAKRMHWQELVPGEMPEKAIVPEVFEGDSIELEGHEIRFVVLLPAETLAATAFYIPSARVLVAGDLVFSASHSFMADLNNPESWIDAINQARALGPIEMIYPGHGPAGGPELLDQVTEYMNTWREVAVPGARVADVAREMTRRYPQYIGAIMLWMTRGPGFGLSGAAELGVPPELMGRPE